MVGRASLLVYFLYIDLFIQILGYTQNINEPYYIYYIYKHVFIQEHTDK